MSNDRDTYPKHGSVSPRLFPTGTSGRFRLATRNPCGSSELFPHRDGVDLTRFRFHRPGASPILKESRIVRKEKSPQRSFK